MERTQRQRSRLLEARKLQIVQRGLRKRHARVVVDDLFTSVTVCQSSPQEQNSVHLFQLGDVEVLQVIGHEQEIQPHGFEFGEMDVLYMFAVDADRTRHFAQRSQINIAHPAVRRTGKYRIFNGRIQTSDLFGSQHDSADRFQPGKSVEVFAGIGILNDDCALHDGQPTQRIDIRNRISGIRGCPDNQIAAYGRPTRSSELGNVGLRVQHHAFVIFAVDILHSVSVYSVLLRIGCRQKAVGLRPVGNRFEFRLYNGIFSDRIGCRARHHRARSGRFRRPI